MFQDRQRLRYGLVLSALFILLGILFHIIKAGPSSPLTIIFYLVGPALLWIFIRKRPIERRVQFWPSYKDMLVVAAIGSTIYALFVFVFNGFVDSSYLELVRAQAMQSVADRGLEGEAAADAVKMVAAFTNAPMFALSTGFQLWMANAVLALPILAIATRKDRSDPSAA